MNICELWLNSRATPILRHIAFQGDDAQHKEGAVGGVLAAPVVVPTTSTVREATLSLSPFLLSRPDDREGGGLGRDPSRRWS